MRVGTRLLLLLWKNWKVRRHRLCSLICEFVTLLVVVLLCVLIKVLKDKAKVGSYLQGVPKFDKPPTDFSELQKRSEYGYNRPIFYAPNNIPLANEIMEYVQNKTNIIARVSINFTGFETEDQLLKRHYQLSQEEGASRDRGRQSTNEVKHMSMAIILNVPEKSRDWSYKLRVVEPGESGYDFLSGDPLKQTLFPPGNRLGDGRADRGQEGKGGYTFTGFLGIQFLLDQIMIEKLTGIPSTVKMTLQAMPYPPYIRDDSRFFDDMVSYLVAPFILFAYIITFLLTIKMVIEEKESGFKELLKINGLANWMHWVGWTINSVLTFLIISIVLTIVFYTTELVNATPFYLFFPIVLLYGFSLTAFAFFISTLFQRAAVGAWMGFLIWFVGVGACAGVIESKKDFLTDTDKYLVCLVPMGAVWLAGTIMRTYGSLLETFTLGHVILMFILTTIMYIILALYLENVIPSKFGARKPFYYPITSLIALFKRNKIGDEVNMGAGGGSLAQFNSSTNFEPDPTGLRIGVSIKKLTKVFHGKRAVDQLSKGQITVLLGHNGAGKTTLIAMLTGLTRPSGGTASINGHNIKTDLSGARQNLAVCPQENRLLGKLTVSDHFILFARLKGLSAREAKAKATELAVKIGLGDKLKERTERLSGGQQRKVQLGMAILGNTQVVFLDEPSSGIDAESRRSIWDLIAGFRKDRAIVLTTHHMEEADVLADRIAIMSGGKLKCIGSTAYLKKFYGQGYTLKVVISEKEKAKAKDKENEKEPLSKQPSSTQKRKPSASTSASTTRSLNTKGGTQNKDKKKGSASNLSQSPKGQRPVPTDNPTGQPPAAASEILAVLQNHAPGSKLVKFRRDVDKKEVQLDFNIPAATDGDTTSKFPALLSQLEAKKQNLAVVSMGLAYTNMDDVFQKVAEDEEKLRENELKSKGKPGKEKPGRSGVSRKRISMVQRRRGCFWFCSCRLLALVIKKLLVMLKGRGLLACQVLLTLLLFLCALLIIGEIYTPRNKQFPPMSIRMSPYTDPITKFTSDDPSLTKGFQTAVKSSGGPSPQEVKGDITKDILELGTNDKKTYLNKLIIAAELSKTSFNGMASQAAYHSEPLVLNLLTNTLLAKIAQDKGPDKRYSISVVNHPISTNFKTIKTTISIAQLYDFVKNNTRLFAWPRAGGGDWFYTFVFAFLAYFGLAVLAASFVVLPTEERLNKVKLLTRMAGAGPVTYFFSLFICDFGLVLILSALMVALVPLLVACGYNIPYDGSGLANCTLAPGGCFEELPYFGEFNSGAIILFLFILLFEALIYTAILLLVESGCCRMCKKGAQNMTKPLFLTTTDSDVKEEAKRVDLALALRQVSSDALYAAHFSKNYGTFLAVSDLSFGVHYGECFGLLGVNGAGKTTMFKMLTGDENPSSGDALMLGRFKLSIHRAKFLGNIGFCPQFDAILGVLTGRQMLELMCRLRGVYQISVKNEAQQWLVKMGLENSGDVACGEYSGGMKRRLSAAMALIGNPPLVLLDEPSTGVDPHARRQFWDILAAQQNSGQAIILTSHSMDECEFLCNRLGVMVNGQMQCFGGVEHLKQKFAQGYTITITLKRQSQGSGPSFLKPVDVTSPPTYFGDSKHVESLNKVKKQIKSKFPKSELKDEHQNTLEYQVKDTTLTLTQIFTNMEGIKKEDSSLIEEYSVSDTTLEEIFLSFARQQYSGREANVKCCKRCLMRCGLG